jgi:hypothetical protein
MLGSAILETALGLVFVYLILSLVVSAIQELLDTILKLRASHLSAGVEKLLGDDKAKEFFDNVLIRALSPNAWFGSVPRRPSYVPPDVFAATVLDMLSKASASKPRTFDEIQLAVQALPEGSLKKSLISLLEQGGRTVEGFKGALQTWFDQHMDRVTGWYKRKVQLITLGVGLALAVAIDADTLSIVNALSKDSALRSAMVAQAQMYATQNPGPAGNAGTDQSAELGKRLEVVKQRFGESSSLGVPIGFDRWPPTWPDRMAKGRQGLLGWILTACAISLGAPFWFDMLSKVVSIRASGKTPDERAREKTR